MRLSVSTPPLRWLLWSGLLVLLVAQAARAQMTTCPTPGKGLDPVAFESVTVGATAIGLTEATITTNTADAAYVTLEGAAPMRFAFVGTPTATVGHLVDPPPAGNAGSGAGTWLCGRAALLGFRAIRTGGTDVTLKTTYFRQR